VGFSGFGRGRKCRLRRHDRSHGSNGDALRNLGIKCVGIHRGDGGVEQFLGGVNGFGHQVGETVLQDVEDDDAGNGVDQSPQGGEQGDRDVTGELAGVGAAADLEGPKALTIPMTVPSSPSIGEAWAMTEM
jgi:hypothetical protein